MFEKNIINNNPENQILKHLSNYIFTVVHYSCNDKGISKQLLQQKSNLNKFQFIIF